MSATTLRLDLHPSDLDHPNHMVALEWVLKRSVSCREAVTYDELASRSDPERLARIALERATMSRSHLPQG